MQKKLILDEFIKQLKEKFAKDEELTVNYIYTGQFDPVSTEGFGFWCSEINNDSESLIYYSEREIFYYKGETIYGEFGRAKFVLSEGLIGLLPKGLKEAMVVVAKNKAYQTFYLPTNLLGMS